MRHILMLALCCAPGWLAVPAHAQGTATAYPVRPVRFIVANAAGGLVDTIARTIAQHLSERLGQPVVVDNRPGASEAIAAETTAKAPADGHTLLMASEAAMVFNPILNRKLPYNPQRDFTPITAVAESFFYLVVNPAVPAQSVAELIAVARSRPDKLTFGSLGIGTMQHLLGELLQANAKLTLLHVPYKSSGAAVIDLVSGRIDMMFQGGGGTLAHIRSGKLRALGTTSPIRPEGLQNIPPMTKTGVPDFDVPSSWFGISGPADLPRAIVERLNRDIGELLRAPETREKLAPLGINLAPGTAEAMGERIRRDHAFWSRVIRDARIEPE